MMSVVVLVVALIGISMSDKAAQNRFDLKGLLVVLISLVCDAVSSNFQEKALKVHEASQSEVISMIYSIGVLLLGVLAGVPGEFSV
jgi:adenosine 3'-phospho 5'-phosphosulfate transporter B3